MDTSSASICFYGFLDRMRHPTAVDIVRSIKSFIVSFPFNVTHPENDGKRFQEFLFTMETTIRNHPLWSGATEDEIDNAVEGLEKYVMTKLFNRTFILSPEDSKVDEEISDKVHLLQYFVKPEHLDIPGNLQNESSLLLAEKELLKINTFRAPREKFLCVFNCCRIINNLLLNTEVDNSNAPPGADIFIPILIYVTIKANPPQLHSNLKFIKLYRRQSKLISESEYYLTSLLSAVSFIMNLNATSLSICENEFQESMNMARTLEMVSMKSSASTSVTDHLTPEKIFQKLIQIHKFDEAKPEIIYTPASSFISRPPLKNHEEENAIVGEEYPFMEADATNLSVEDVFKLLSAYKQIVRKYSWLQQNVIELSIEKEILSLVLDLEQNIPLGEKE